MSLDVVVDNPGARIGVAKSVLAVVAFTPPDHAMMSELRRAHATALRFSPAGYACVIFVREGSTPSVEMRASMTSTFAKMMSDGAAVAIVLESTGFVAAAQRAIATTFLAATGSKRMRVASSLSDADGWLRGLVPGLPRSDDLAAMVGQMRR